ncbi:MAG: hypothetical protein WKF59_01685 [Chitinophagaceae bacterium]
MAENRDEEYLKTTSIPLSENPSDQNNPTIDTDTNTNPEIENMEVHKHPHHVTHKKKWTEYLLEFFMLFLAVFLGFVAENKREHIVENHRAHDYAKSFLNDLQADTIELRGAISAGRFMGSAMDSITEISLRFNGKTVPGTFYYYSRFMSNLWTLDWSKSTINQLIQSGNLRYFKNKAIVNKINSYYAWQDLIFGDNQVEHETRMKLVDLRNKILQSKYYSVFASLDLVSSENGHIASLRIDSLNKAQLPLMPNAFMYMDEYINLIADRKWRQEPVLNGRYPKALNVASELIILLKEEYKLK